MEDSVKSWSFKFESPVVMYRCDSWIIKKAELWRMDALKLWCWRRLLRVHWTARRSYQSVLKEINSDYSLKELMLKLKLQYFDHLTPRADSSENTLMLGKIEGRRKSGQQDEMVEWHHGLNRHESEQAPGDSERQGSLSAVVHGVTKSLTWRSNWTTTIFNFKFSWENHSVLLKLILSMLHPNALGSLWSYHAHTPWTQLLCPFVPSMTIFAEL